jgi:hypothetical protein
VCNSVAYQICYGYKQEEEGAEDDNNGGWMKMKRFIVGCSAQYMYTKVDKRSFSTVFMIFSYVGLFLLFRKSYPDNYWVAA